MEETQAVRLDGHHVLQNQKEEIGTRTGTETEIATLTAVEKKIMTTKDDGTRIGITTTIGIIEIDGGSTRVIVIGRKRRIGEETRGETAIMIGKGVVVDFIKTFLWSFYR